jgi:hypothetical protein
VSAVSANALYGFSKSSRENISFDREFRSKRGCPCGHLCEASPPYTLAPADARRRQVHLIDESLFDVLRSEGFSLDPGGTR